MHLVIINGAARPQAKSNTVKIIAAFGQGYAECGNTTEIYYLSDRRQWTQAEKAFLETLPAQLGCEYAGTLIKGDMFGVGLVDEKNREKMLAPFADMGRVFARSGQFEKSVVDTFAAPEYMPKKQIRTYNLFGKHISRFFMGQIAKKLGCKEKLDARPLAE